jgi:hypothetical protein
MFNGPLLANRPFMSKFALQVDGRQLLQIPLVLSQLLDASPLFAPAAIKANLAPSLIRILRKFRKARRPADAGPNDLFAAYECSAKCLKQLFEYDMDNGKTLWKPAVDLGIMPIFLDLLTVDHNLTKVEVTMAAGFLLLSVPAGQAESVDAGIMRTIAGLLLTSSSPLVLGTAVDILFNVGYEHPELIVDCRTWGIEQSLQRLTLHAEADVATAAKNANDLLFHMEEEFLNVSSIPGLPICAVARFPFGLYMFAIAGPFWWLHPGMSVLVPVLSSRV